MYSNSCSVKECIKIAAAGTVRPKTGDPLTIGANDNSRNLWKPKAFSDTREILFP